MSQTAAAIADSSVPDTQQLAAQVAALSAQCDAVQRENVQLRAQVTWFQRQLFGSKSEKRIVEPDAAQGTLGEAFDAAPDTPAPGRKTRVAGHERIAAPKRPAADESTLFFDENKVPVEVIQVPNTESEGLDPEDVEVIGERVSHRLAQRPGSYVILKYVRPVIKRRDTQQLSCPAAPVGVLEGSRADVSFIAGLLVDKLCYHLPLYRQHQRLAQAGVKVSRLWLTQVAQSAIALLEPIHDAQWQSILASRVKKMDETPIKAGRDGPGKMKSAYFWPVMGEADEICFHYQPSRRQKHVEQMLGQTVPAGGVLHTDDYSAYAWYAKKTGIAHAQCWAHSRRGFIKAGGIEPDNSSSPTIRCARLCISPPDRARTSLSYRLPLYTMKEVFSKEHGLPLTEANLLGVVSLIVWGLTIIVTLKYVTLILRADNRGEGGIMALMALAMSSVTHKSRWHYPVMLIGLTGAALFYGDGVITPAISVLSAIEGLEVATPTFQPYVTPITVTVLMALYRL